MAAARCRKRRLDHTNELVEVSIVNLISICINNLYYLNLMSIFFNYVPRSL